MSNILDNEDNLISIIIPLYNSEKYIKDTIDSIQNQTYKNWEIIVIDDCSTDNSVMIIEQMNIKNLILIKENENKGAAHARNIGINKARGKFITFIDADDLWKPQKLEKQLMFTLEHNYEFTYTGYEFGDEFGLSKGKVVKPPTSLNYKQALKNTTISTITVMFNMNLLNKNVIYMSLDSSREDTATWWKILKTGIIAYGLEEPLSIYRRHSKSSSANKLKAIKDTWKMYRRCEKLSIMKTLYYFAFYVMNAIRRRL